MSSAPLLAMHLLHENCGNYANKITKVLVTHHLLHPKIVRFNTVTVLKELYTNQTMKLMLNNCDTRQDWSDSELYINTLINNTGMNKIRHFKNFKVNRHKNHLEKRFYSWVNYIAVVNNALKWLDEVVNIKLEIPTRQAAITNISSNN